MLHFKYGRHADSSSLLCHQQCASISRGCTQQQPMKAGRASSKPDSQQVRQQKRSSDHGCKYCDKGKGTCLCGVTSCLAGCRCAVLGATYSCGDGFGDGLCDRCIAACRQSNTRCNDKYILLKLQVMLHTSGATYSFVERQQSQYHSTVMYTAGVCVIPINVVLTDECR